MNKKVQRKLGLLFVQTKLLPNKINEYPLSFSNFHIQLNKLFV